MRPRWRLAGAAVLLLALTLRQAAGAGVEEPYMVLSRRAELYQREHLAPVRLSAGEIVLARPNELYRDWLDVQLDGTAYQTKAMNCARLGDLLLSYARRGADLQSRIRELGRDIAARENTADQLHAAELAIRSDATVQYRYREARPTSLPDTSATGTVSGPPTPPGVPLVQYVDRYEDKIAPARARQLADRWERERRELERDAQRLRQQRRERVQEEHALEAQRNDAQERFRSFRPQAGLGAPRPYVVVQERTALYAGDRLVHELSADAVVLAGLNREDERWLRVLWHGQTLDARRSHFLNRLDLELQSGGRAAWLERATHDATERGDLLGARRQLLEAVALAADYASRLEYTAVRAYPFAGGYAGQRYYLPPLCPGPATEVVDRSRARGLLKVCDREIDDIEDQLRDTDRNLRAWHRELASLSPRLDDLRRRLGSVH